MLVTTADEIGRRRHALRNAPDLATLAERLGRLGDEVVRSPLYLPEQKALLSRDGGVCSRDGSRLSFDPFSPDQHECPACHNVYDGDRHHRAWVWRYHLWLTERAIHLALLDRLGVRHGAAATSREIVVRYSQAYRDFPNVDNVLGPTRLFFSTYLESIWLIQLIIAASLLDWEGAEPQLDDLRSVVRESASLIASFDEGWSNRQVWNSTALVAAGRWLDDATLLQWGAEGPHGVMALLTQAVSEGGRWHEGENYHFFALRGFQLAAELLRQAGIDLYRDDPWQERLRGMYTAPLTTVLPDLSVPARGDSPFGVTLLQPRFAELWEIAWSRTDDTRLAGLLTAMYQADVQQSDDHGLCEIAEVEQNRPARRLSRSDLGWKALLWMRDAAPQGDPCAWMEGSVLVGPGGPAVLRPAPERYAGLECSGTGSGHGHPDRLHVTLYWDRPWLVDVGTGSYVAESLHWYRSTLAHNAPGLRGAGQLGGRAWCSAFDERGEWAWCRGVAEGMLGPETTVTRTIVTGPDCVVDVVDVSAPEDCTVDLPLHVLGEAAIDAVTVRDAPDEFRPDSGAGHETGYGAVDHPRLLVEPPALVRHVSDERQLDVFLPPRDGESCYRVRGPGPSSLDFADTERRDFVVRRSVGPGQWVQVYAPPSAGITGVTVDGGVVAIEGPEGALCTVAVGGDGARIVGSGDTEVRLEGLIPEPEEPVHQPLRRTAIRCQLLDRAPTVDDYFDSMAPGAPITLGPSHYRRSEMTYPGESVFGGRVGVAAHARHLYVGVEVRKPKVVLRAADVEDPRLDNEVPDIHSDGVQIYLDWHGRCGFVAVPEAEGEGVRIRPVAGTTAGTGQLTGTWRRTNEGYRVLLRFDAGADLVAGDHVLVQVVVNEMQPGRERRAGQLALAGGGGWVYLRGDRESWVNAVRAEVR
jgi:hypothetical protein